jgi:hypothetical protein
MSTRILENMMSNSVWATLSAINCNEHVAKKGQFSYLSWTWAWAMVKEQYPLSRYQLEDDIVYPDGTMEVRIEVTVQESDGEEICLRHTMWLPVLNHQNKAIANPNAMDINSARMRCLVKCLAMFGLGHYIYPGESVPQEPVITESPEMVRAGAEINACLEADDLPGAAQLYDEWEHSELTLICRAPSNGGQLTTANRAKLKETDFRLALNEVRGIDMEGVG